MEAPEAPGVPHHSSKPFSPDFDSKVLETGSNLCESLRNQLRSAEQVQIFLATRADLKERDLRSFLIPRPLLSDSDGPQSTQSSISAPIPSTISAIRPVPTLVSGTTKPVDGILGPIQPSSRSDPRRCSQPQQPISQQPPDPTSADESEQVFSRVPVDQSVNLVLSRLRRAQSKCNALVTANQTEQHSFTYTQNSINGKRIMMRIRVLERENEELTKMNRSGRTARLRTEIALRRRFVQDMKQSFSDMEYLVEETESESELLGNSLLMLQQRLQLAKITAQVLATELDSIVPGKAAEIFQQANWSPYDPEDEVILDAVSDGTVQVTSEPSILPEAEVGDQESRPPLKRNRVLSDIPSDTITSRDRGADPVQTKRVRISDESACPTDPLTSLTNVEQICHPVDTCIIEKTKKLSFIEPTTHGHSEIASSNGRLSMDHDID